MLPGGKRNQNLSEPCVHQAEMLELVTQENRRILLIGQVPCEAPDIVEVTNRT